MIVYVVSVMEVTSVTDVIRVKLVQVVSSHDTCASVSECTGTHVPREGV